jgi:peptide alpha-N-acetyltransferase
MSVSASVQPGGSPAASSAAAAAAAAAAARVHYEVYKSEAQLPLIERLMEADLSEPYCVFTYRYFVNQWPALCYLAFVGDECVGAIVGRLDWHRKSETYRGYIAMLCVDKAFRGRGIGTRRRARARARRRADGGGVVRGA